MSGVFDSNVSFKLSFGFGVNPYTTPTSTQWIDVSSYVRAGHYERGRSNELDDISAATAEFRLDNRDRRFDPSNTGSPHSPNVKPMTPVRLQTIYGGTTYDRYYGFVEGWPQVWTDVGFGQETTVRAVDGFRLFSFTETATTHASEKSGARINSYLTEVGWSTGQRSIATGQVTVDAYAGQCAAVLEEVKRVEESEHGLFFVGRDGKATFQSSTYRNGGTPSSTFSDTGGVPYSHLTVEYDDMNIWNDITVSGVNVASQAVNSTASIDAYGRRKLKVFDTLHTNATGAQDYANKVLGTYASPQTRFTMDVTPAVNSTAAWPAVFGSELSDLFRIRRTPSTGSQISQDVYVESIEEDFTVEKDWVVSYSLSPST